MIAQTGFIFLSSTAISLPSLMLKKYPAALLRLGFFIPLLQEALTMVSRRIAVARHGIKKYNGTAEEICSQIVKECWNSTFFQTSTGHFSLFYMRDFGMCVQSLLKAGYEKEVKNTLQFALAVYSRENKCSTTISKSGRGFNVFSYAPDTLAFLLSSLRIAKAHELVEIYKPFLENELEYYYHSVVDDSGIVKKGNFSSIKDHAKRQQSCYDSCCIAVVAREAHALNLKNRFNKNYSEIIKKTFWNGLYFKDTIGHDYPAGDANVFPYWLRVFDDKKMIRSSIKAMQTENLDKPFPLKYSQQDLNNFFFPLKIVAPNYEGSSIWMHLGLCYVDVVEKVDKKLAEKYRQKYKRIIETHKNFLELFNADGTLYKTLLYHADEGMLWACKFIKH